MPAASAINSEASGVWTLRDAERLKRAGTWPTAPTVPGAPTGLAATAGNAQLSLSWTAPASNGGAAITGYRVQYTPSGGSASTVDTGSATASYTLTGLTNGTSYTVSVAAINGVGAGAYSSTATATPVGTFFSTLPTGATGDGNAASPLVFDVSYTTKTATAAVSGTLRITGTYGDSNENGPITITVGGVTVYSNSYAISASVNITRSITAGQQVVIQNYGMMPNATMWIV